MSLRSIDLLIAVIFLGSAAVSSTPAETPRTCTPLEARQARREASRLQDWQSIYGSFKRFGGCDHGKVGEEYTYAVSRLLAHDWGHVDVLLELAANDREFKQFVLQHVDENIPEEEAQLIIRNSRQRCPINGEWLCKAIVDY